MKITVNMEDNLQEIVAGAIDGVKEELISYLADNADTEEVPDLGNGLDYSGAIHEIIDGSVPVYTQQIGDIMYLHGPEVEKAFDDAGIGEKDDEGWPNGWHAAAIYCYIEREVNEWYHANAVDVFDEWQEARSAKAE